MNTISKMSRESRTKSHKLIYVQSSFEEGEKITSTSGDELQPTLGTLYSDTSRYLIHSIMGEGAFGKVLKCFKETTNEMVACKVLKASKFTSQDKGEVDVLTRLMNFDADRFNFVKFNDAFIYNDHVCMDFEMLDMSLLDMMNMRPERSFTVKEIRPILCQVATTLALLESEEIVHTDLKPDNIMFVDHVKHPLKVKVIDFGLALTSSQFGQVLLLQAPAYRSPEVILGNPFTSAIDMWALGCIAVELFLGRYLFPATSEYNLLHRIIYTGGELPQKLLKNGLRTEEFFSQRMDPVDPFRSKFILTDSNDDEISGIESDYICLDDLPWLKSSCHLPEEDIRMEYQDMEDFVKLIKRMLDVDPEKRITPAELIHHPFITMTNLRDKYPSSSYFKSCSEMMEVCQGQDLNLILQEVAPAWHNDSEPPVLQDTAFPYVGDEIQPIIFEKEEKTSSLEGNELPLILGTLFSDTSRYLIHSIMGEGAFGKVLKCFKETTNEMVACKVLKASKFTSQEKGEVDVLTRLMNFDAGRFNFVKFNDAFLYNDHVCLDFEMLDMSLLDMMNMRPEHSFTVKEIRPILCQVATTLALLESVEIVHTDLKPDNIMFVDHVKCPLKVKVIDFGLALTSSQFGQVLLLQAPAYRSPEVILGNPFTSAIDMWALGCIAVELFLGRYLFPATSEHNLLHRIIYTGGELPQKLLKNGERTEEFFSQRMDPVDPFRSEFILTDSNDDEISGIESDYICLDDLPWLKSSCHLPEEDIRMEYQDMEDFVKLIKRMLDVDPEKRITPAELIHHPFITMTNLRDKYPNSSYFKSCSEMMEVCQGQDLNLILQEVAPAWHNDSEPPVLQDTSSPYVGDEIQPIIFDEKENTPSLEGNKLPLIQGTLFSDTSRYLIHSIMGEGAFGKVLKCFKETTNEMVACKVLKASKFTSQDKGEVDVLTRLMNFDADRFNFVKFNDEFIYNDHVCMDFEMLDMSLLDMMNMRPERSFTVKEIRPILCQVATTLALLQSEEIVHTDLKPDNIMFVDHVKHPLKVKVIDFGLALTSSQFGQVLLLQAPAYRSPEVILGNPFTSAIDMWALGCIAVELFLGRYLFPATSEYNLLHRIIYTGGELPQKLLKNGLRTEEFFSQRMDSVDPFRSKFILTDSNDDEISGIESDYICLDDLPWLKSSCHLPEEDIRMEYQDMEDFVKLIKRMLDVDPEKRITPAELIHHPFITMTNLRDKYPSSSYFKSCSEMIEVCQGQDLNLILQEVAPAWHNDSEPPVLQDTAFPYVGDEIQPIIFEKEEKTSSLEGNELQPILGTLFSDTSRYLIHSIMGEGAFGEVLKCFKETTNEMVACKVLKASKFTSQEKGEVDVLTRLMNFDADRFNFVKFNDAFLYNDHVCLDFEMLDMSLLDMMNMRPERSFTVKEIRPILCQVATTLALLESEEIVHTDLKPDNIMFVDHVKCPLKVKVIDFGLALTSSRFGQVLLLQAPAYRSPEVILGNPFTSAIDMWALGCIAVELFLGRYLFPATSEYNLLHRIIYTGGELPQKLLKNGLRTEEFFSQRMDPVDPFRSKFILTDSNDDEISGIESDYICLDDLPWLKSSCHLPEEDIRMEYQDMEDFVKLIKRMLDVDPEKRITPAELIHHPFITMTNLRDKYPNSSYFKSCSEMMEVCQGQDLNLILQEVAPAWPNDSEPPVLKDAASLYVGDDIQPIIFEEKEKTSSLEGNELPLIQGTLFSDTSRYLIHSIMGEGAFGKVVKCFKEITNEMVACKVLKASKFTSQDKGEVDVLTRLMNFDADRFNFVKFNDAFIYNNHVCMDFEMLDMSLLDMMNMRPERSFTVKEIRPILCQVATTLALLQSEEIVHTDLKPDNIMFVDHVKHPLKVKVIDFGLALTSSQFGQVLLLQAPAYRSPEVILGNPFTSAIDMWALGCIAVELFLGRYLFPATSEYNLLHRIIYTGGELPQKLLKNGLRTEEFFSQRMDPVDPFRSKFILTDSNHDEISGIESDYICLDDLPCLKSSCHLPEEDIRMEYQDMEDFVKLIKRMLDVDPEKRITPEELIHHPFITMTNLRDKFPNSSCFKSCSEIMEVCQGQDLNLILQEVAPAWHDDSEPPVLQDTASPYVGDEIQPIIFEEEEKTSSLEGNELQPIQGTLFSDTSRYLIHSIMGEGAFGEVLKCFKEATNEMVACKVIKASKFTSQEKGEVDVLTRLMDFDADWFNFVKFNDAFIYNNHVCLHFEMLDMEVCQGQDLNLIFQEEAPAWHNKSEHPLFQDTTSVSSILSFTESNEVPQCLMITASFKEPNTTDLPLFTTAEVPHRAVVKSSRKRLKSGSSEALLLSGKLDGLIPKKKKKMMMPEASSETLTPEVKLKPLKKRKSDNSDTESEKSCPNTNYLKRKWRKMGPPNVSQQARPDVASSEVIIKPQRKRKLDD